MSETAKALISGGVGLIAGLVAQPLTAFLVRLLRTRELSNNLYKDMGRLYHVMDRINELSPPEEVPNSSQQAVDNRTRAQGYFDSSIRIDAFVAAQDTDAALFWGLPEAIAITEVYEELKKTISERTNWGHVSYRIEDVFRLFDRLFKEGSLDEEKLLRYRREHRNDTRNKVTKYHSSGNVPLIRDSIR